jgi:hypothetical protein
MKISKNILETSKKVNGLIKYGTPKGIIGRISFFINSNFSKTSLILIIFLL